MEGCTLRGQHDSLDSHLGLTPHLAPSPELPIGPGPDSPNLFLGLRASQNQVSLQSAAASKPGGGVPQAKEGLRWPDGPSEPPTNAPVCCQLVSLIPYAFPVPARLRSEVLPGLCVRPRVSGFGFLPVPPPPSPPICPFQQTSSPPSFLLPSPLPGRRGPLPLRHGSPSLLSLLKRRFLARSPALPSSPGQRGSGEEKAGLLLGTTTPKVHAE